ncbi:MAG: bacterial proteasome activator family protein [Actinomycetota bacterium]|nr:bacterial proteasome activator family protein [Actinomycetota bacterium]
MSDGPERAPGADTASAPAPGDRPQGHAQGLDRYSTPGQVLDPQRLLRIAGVAREALEEARRIRPEPGAVDHLRRLHGQISSELKEALPTDLYDELDDLTPDVRDGSLEELSLAHAEILGWLEGLFQGTQLALQVRAAQALEHVRRPLPPEAPRREPEERPDSRYL